MLHQSSWLRGNAWIVSLPLLTSCLSLKNTPQPSLISGYESSPKQVASEPVQESIPPQGTYWAEKRYYDLSRFKDGSNTESSKSAPDKDWLWPVAGPISSGFGKRRGRMHKGIDLRAAPKTPVIAAKSGVVTLAGWRRGYGRVVIIKHDGEESSLYSHLSSIKVKKNQKIKQGELVGRVGKSGNARGYHLHFEYHIKGEKPSDPLAVLPQHPDTKLAVLKD